MSSSLEAGSIYYLASSLQPATKSRFLNDGQSLGQSSGEHVPTDNYGRTGCQGSSLDGGRWIWGGFSSYHVGDVALDERSGCFRMSYIHSVH
jgi:hypothetical protein